MSLAVLTFSLDLASAQIERTSSLTSVAKCHSVILHGNLHAQHWLDRR